MNKLILLHKLFNNFSTYEKPKSMRVVLNNFIPPHLVEFQIRLHTIYIGIMGVKSPCEMYCGVNKIILYRR